jgi:predicted AlkP superfamily phosphohydrolase/phosphomutase
MHVYFDEPDSVQHKFWKWYQPKYFLFPKEKNIEAFKDKIPDVYRYYDEWLGNIRKQLEPETVLIIASDHGHTPCILNKDAYTAHRHGPPGILLMNGSPIIKSHVLQSAHVLDLFPTILYLLGLPVPKDSDGKVLEAAFEEEFLHNNPPRYILSYDFVFSKSLLKKEKGLLDKEELERLKSLGYIK